jgi:uncharacterized membrane protein
MNAPTIVALFAVVVGIPLNVYVTAKLWTLSRQAPRVRVLRERAIVASFVLLVVTVFGLIFLNNDLVPPLLSFDTTKFVTRLTMLALAIVPACYWLWLYRPTR